MLHVSQNIDQKFIDRLQQILEENIENEHFGVSELAMAVGVSRSNLHRKVHAYNGNSTSQFIREFRLKKAIALLQHQEGTVAEIAYRVGFSSPTYFNTCFKDYYGYPPGEAKTIHQRTSFENPDRPGINSKYEGLNSRWMLGLLLTLMMIAVLSTSYYIRIGQPSDRAQSEYTIKQKSIAVLPIKNWSGNPDLDYIGDGMTDAIITRLTKISSIAKVTPFTSVMQYKASEKSAVNIAEELSVTHILQGNFQLSGDQIKIKLQLIDGHNNTHSWSEEYNGTWNSDDVFQIQSNVVEHIAERMDVTIVDEEKEALNKNPTQNREAYNYWLKAKYQSLKYTKEGMENALPLFEKAIDLDSNFIEPYVDMAYVYLFGGGSWGLHTEKEAWQTAKGLLIDAKKIDSTNLRVKSALTDGLYIYEWDFETMERNYRTASNLGIIYRLQSGRHSEALEVIEYFYKEQPQSVFYHSFKAQALYFLDRKQEASDLLRSSDKLYSDQIMYLRAASRFHYYLENYAASKALLTKLLAQFPDRPPVVLWLGALHKTRDDDIEGANLYLRELKRRFNTGESGSPAWFLALYYSSTADPEKAIEWLRRSYENHDMEMIWLREEPALRPLRDDPRYLGIYHKVGFPLPAKTPR